MSFADDMRKIPKTDIQKALETAGPERVVKALSRDRLSPGDLAALLSDAADRFLEPMARKAGLLTRRHFGRTIGLYAPLYISDFCSNRCSYCGFRADHSFGRQTLGLDAIEAEAKALAATGIRHVLILTGEAPKRTPMAYLLGAVSVLKRWFASIAIEIFPMDTEDYRRLKKAGVDGLTVYQEVYDREVYRRVHLSGPKTDYEYRLTTPERGAEAGFRALGIGPLFGLGEPRSEAFYTALHARYLEHRFPGCEISVSLPRMNKAEGGIASLWPVSDRLFVRIMLAFRLFLPRAGITVSTREGADFREHLLHLGATRFSAGSRTDVGGYTRALNNDRGTGQFDITDTGSVREVTAMIRKNGLDPVFKDWEAVE